MPELLIVKDISYKMYHLELSRELSRNAQVAIIPGAPERAALIAASLADPVRVASHRGLDSWVGTLSGKPVLVTNTGMGGPTTEIVVQELAQLGVTTFLRIGTCGAIREDIPVGSLIVTEAAVRLDGTSEHYAPLRYPAVADLDLTLALRNAAQSCGVPVFSGITASSASFYPGQERYDSAGGYVREAFRGSVDEWRALGVLNFEMESGTLFTMCRTMGLKAGCLCAAVANRTQSEAVVRDVIRRSEEAATKAGLLALEKVMGK